MRFPEYYGMNMDAWIDCMSDIEEPLCIEVLNTVEFNRKLPKIVSELIECCAIVNHRLAKSNQDIYLVLKFL